jgi:arylsulfatase A-like enzyme
MAKKNSSTPSKPNILVIWRDDIGITNLSCYSDGLMGYRTPNIDRLAKEGMRFTDSYGEQSCTAGRSAFITGKASFGRGLSKVGVPAAALGLQAEDPTIAELLNRSAMRLASSVRIILVISTSICPLFMASMSFSATCITSIARSAENVDYPKDPAFREKFGPRGVLHCWATQKDDTTQQPRWGKVGEQKIEDTGPFTAKRMETCDDEFVAAAKDWIKRQHEAGKPFFCWVNTTHMTHVYAHQAREHRAGRPMAIALPRHYDRSRQECRRTTRSDR